MLACTWNCKIIVIYSGRNEFWASCPAFCERARSECGNKSMMGGWWTQILHHFCLHCYHYLRRKSSLSSLIPSHKITSFKNRQCIVARLRPLLVGPPPDGVNLPNSPLRVPYNLLRSLSIQNTRIIPPTLFFPASAFLWKVQCLLEMFLLSRSRFPQISSRCPRHQVSRRGLLESRKLSL